MNNNIIQKPIRILLRSPKDKVEKNKKESTSYASYTSHRPDRQGPIHRKYRHSDIWACDNLQLLMATGGLWKNIHVTITITINNFNNKKIHGNHKKLKNLLATYQL